MIYIFERIKKHCGEGKNASNQKLSSLGLLKSLLCFKELMHFQKTKFWTFALHLYSLCSPTILDNILSIHSKIFSKFERIALANQDLIFPSVEKSGE